MSSLRTRERQAQWRFTVTAGASPSNHGYSSRLLMLDELRRILGQAPSSQTLAQIIDLIRPTRGQPNPAVGLRHLVALLQRDEARRAAFGRHVREVLGSVRLVHALIGSGIVAESGLWSQLVGRLSNAVLPQVHPEDDLRSVLPNVFTRDDDWAWVASVPSNEWAALFALVVVDSDVIGLPHRDVGAAIRALAQRIGAEGIDEEVNAKLPFVEDYDSPFLDLTVAAHAFLEDHRHEHGSAETFEAAIAAAGACRAIVWRLRDDKQTHGTSMRLTTLTRRMLQQLQRFELLLRLVHPRSTDELARSIAPLFQELVEAEQTGNRVRRVVSHTVDLLAHQITEHTATKGEKYVGRTRRAYLGFLLAAMGGGALVAVFAVLKLFLSQLDLPLAMQALVYGLNYSVCFVLIYLTGAILATKQPAITASAIARQLDGAATRREGLERIADTIMLVWRSQFVSFVGNLVCAFPVAIAIAYGLELLLGIKTADATKVEALLDANHPWQSLALFYAGIAGIFLFSAGVIQGVVDNRIRYTELGPRLEGHPKLAFLGARRAHIVRAAMKHASGVISNSALGFMLGSAGVVGLILGLPIDIRHIAFSSSHVGVAVLDAPQIVDAASIYIVLVGLLGIGFVNFVVSFGLTLTVSLKSRRVTFDQTGALLAALARRLVSRPLHWFLPLGQYPEPD